MLSMAIPISTTPRMCFFVLFACSSHAKYQCRHGVCLAHRQQPVGQYLCHHQPRQRCRPCAFRDFSQAPKVVTSHFALLHCCPTYCTKHITPLLTKCLCRSRLLECCSQPCNVHILVVSLCSLECTNLISRHLK
jgi:hypothetical protein